MKFDINNYKGRYVMHCKTEAEAREFCNYLHSIGRKWDTRESYLDLTDWTTYKEHTVYYFNEGMFGSCNCEDVDSYTILEFSDFDWTKEFTKTDLKTGDIVQYRNGETRIVIREMNIVIGNNVYNTLADYNEDLTHYWDEGYDIVAVRRPNEAKDCQFRAFDESWGTLVYEEVEEIMTLEEVCKLLGERIKIIQ